MPKKPTIPTTLPANKYAVIKLEKFDNLQIAILADDENGGIAVSYEDSHLSPVDKIEVEKEIHAIISQEMDKIIEEDT